MGASFTRPRALQSRPDNPGLGSKSNQYYSAELFATHALCPIEGVCVEKLEVKNDFLEWLHVDALFSHKSHVPAHALCRVRLERATVARDSGSASIDLTSHALDVCLFGFLLFPGDVVWDNDAIASVTKGMSSVCQLSPTSAKASSTTPTAKANPQTPRKGVSMLQRPMLASGSRNFSLTPTPRSPMGKVTDNHDTRFALAIEVQATIQTSLKDLPGPKSKWELTAKCKSLEVQTHDDLSGDVMADSWLHQEAILKSVQAMINAKLRSNRKLHLFH